MAKKTKKRTVKKAIDTSRKTKNVMMESDIMGAITHGSVGYQPNYKAVDVIKALQGLVKKHGKECFIKQNAWSDYDRYDLYAVVPETDEEYEDRMKRNKKAREAAKKAAITRKKMKERKDKEEWERLSKKFGKNRA